MKGDVVPKFVRSEEMLADGFTKPYAGEYDWGSLHEFC